MVLGEVDGTAVLVGVGVLVGGVVVVGVVGAGVVGVVGGVVVVGVVGVVVDGEVGAGVLDDGVPGGVPVVGSAVVGLFVPGPVSGKLDVDPALGCGANGFNGLPTGSDGRALDRDVPSDRSTVGLEEPAAWGT